MFYLIDLTGIYQGFLDSMSRILGVILSVLPLSPFAVISEYSLDSELLMFLNYLLPISEILTITELWLTAIVAFYVWQVVLRWVKACE